MNICTGEGEKIKLLGNRLAELRKKKGETQEQTAKKLGLTRSAYSQYELGTRNPDTEILKKMADHFERSIDYLLGRDAKRERIEDTLPESVMDRVIREAEEHFGVSLRDDPDVNEAVRELIYSLAKMKKK